MLLLQFSLRVQRGVENPCFSGLHLGLMLMALVASSPRLGGAVAPPQRPNFLIVTYEDVSPHFGVYGDPALHAEGHAMYLVYSVGGEQGLAIARTSLERFCRVADSLPNPTKPQSIKSR